MNCRTMRLLLIEDSPRLTETLMIGLRKAGFAVDHAADGKQGLWLAESHSYDAIILDVMLPLMDGVSVVRRLRQGGSQTHVLMLTAKDRLEDKVGGLQSGADDYMVKPFAFEELLARLGVLVRRAHSQSSGPVIVGSLAINTVARTATVAGQRVTLSAREYAVLEYLALRRGQIVSRADVEAHVYDGNADLMSNVVDTVICALRRKIDQPGLMSFIRTRRGMGYEMVEGNE